MRSFWCANIPQSEFRCFILSIDHETEDFLIILPEYFYPGGTLALSEKLIIKY